MFDTKIYSRRRDELKSRMKSGILLFSGNDESPMNYADNTYAYRQDSSFLYYWGLDFPGLAAVIDLDENRDIIFGDELTMDDIVWMGPQPTLKERARQVGVVETMPSEELAIRIRQDLRRGRKVHFLPQYRPDNTRKLEKLLGIGTEYQSHYVSTEFIKAVVAQRSLKSPEEVAEIEKALEISYEMQTTAMKMIRPGMVEREIAGAMTGIAKRLGEGLSFPIIFSVHGETLHNHHHGNVMQEGQLAVNDSGAESGLHYAGDITRTIPVSGRFSGRQREIYDLVLSAQLTAIEAIRPGVKYRDVHLKACRTIAEGLQKLGLMKGDLQEAVGQGAHALFMPHGLGHMMGLDVHDMENLGEQYVGYDEQTRRSQQFGLAALRLGRELQPGFVLTVEPGIYFIPQLIEQWQAEKKFAEFLNYPEISRYADFGGIRIEDDVLVEAGGCRVLGRPIPKTVSEVEAVCASE